MENTVFTDDYQLKLRRLSYNISIAGVASEKLDDYKKLFEEDMQDSYRTYALLKVGPVIKELSKKENSYASVYSSVMADVTTLPYVKHQIIEWAKEYSTEGKDFGDYVDAIKGKSKSGSENLLENVQPSRR